MLVESNLRKSLKNDYQNRMPFFVSYFVRLNNRTTQSFSPPYPQIRPKYIDKRSFELYANPVS